MSETLKPWYAVGTPHEDIRKGRLEEPVFPANIWAVVQGTTEEIDLTGIDWVIVGGKSGPKADPCPLVGERYPRPVPDCRSAFLLQAVGRIKQEKNRSGIGRSNMGRYGFFSGDVPNFTPDDHSSRFTK